MKLEGLKGCFEKTRGVFYFARMCSKIRLHAQGKLPKDYHEELGQGFDGRTCRYLGVRYEDVRAQVFSGKTDAEVLEWCFANGRRLTEEEILIYNSFISKRGWHDDESDGFLAEMIKKLGLKDGTEPTYLDLIEMDEGSLVSRHVARRLEGARQRLTNYIAIQSYADYSAGKYREETTLKPWRYMTESERQQYTLLHPPSQTLPRTGGRVLSTDPDAGSVWVTTKVPVPEYRSYWRLSDARGSILPDVRMPWFVLGVTYAALFFLLKETTFRLRLGKPMQDLALTGFG